jgi:hypothetical protein
MTERRTLARRRGRAVFLGVLAVSAGAHLAVLTLMMSGLRPDFSPMEDPPIEVRMLAPRNPPPRPEPVKKTLEKPAATPSAKPASATPPVPGRAQAATPAAPSAGVNLPSNAPTDGAGMPPGLSAGLRRQLGCSSADFMKLTPAERARCNDRLADARWDKPALAVISPEKKAIFDGECRKDDAWCLYRIGKGPYPGLMSLLKK